MPTSLMGMIPTCGTVSIQWQPPADDGGDTISGYTVSVPGRMSEAVGNVTSYEVTGLEVNVDYSVEVFATNCAGIGAPATLAISAKIKSGENIVVAREQLVLLSTYTVHVYVVMSVQ